MALGMSGEIVEDGILARTSSPLSRPPRQQTQQTFHFQVLRLACPDATNIEAGAHSV
jgi:hypothetical protein